jgi:hypothetical protein
MALTTTTRAADFRIVYDSSGTTRIEVSKKGAQESKWQMKMSWITHRLPFDEKIETVDPQSMESFDSHSAEIKLTKAELAQFENWIKQSGIFDLKVEYPERSTKTYGSAFTHSLAVDLDGKKYSLNWTGDTETPEALGKAVGQLIKLGREIERNPKRQ